MGKLGKNKKIKKAPLVPGSQPKEEKVKSGTFINLPVEVLEPNPYQPRKVWDEDSLQELAESIRENGVLHSLSVFQKDGQYYIAAGERRLRASKIAGLKTVPCLVTNGNPAEIGLLENLQREDLRPIEEAYAYERMLEEFGYTQEKLAKIVGKSKSIVSETLSLLKLPEEIKEEIRRVEFNMPKRELIKIARLKDPEEQKKAFFNKSSLKKKKKRVKKINLKEIANRLEKITEVLDLYLEDFPSKIYGDKEQQIQSNETWEKKHIKENPVFWASIETERIIREIKGEKNGTK